MFAHVCWLNMVKQQVLLICFAYYPGYLPHVRGKVSLQVFEFLLGFIQLMGNVPECPGALSYLSSETGRTEKYHQEKYKTS